MDLFLKFRVFFTVVFVIGCISADEGDDSNEIIDDDESSSEHCDCKQWADWTEYSLCSKQCGRGKQRRSRSRTCNKEVIITSQGEIYCSKNFTQSRVCNIQPCGCESVCTNWSPWINRSCTRECGGGIHTSTRRRGCRWSQGCLQFDSKKTSCNEGPCPECSCDMWSAWSAYDQCSASCGLGVQTRQRRRSCHALSFGQDCSKATVEVSSSPCNYGLCCKDICTSWSSWTQSSCSATCDKGSLEKMRSRFCAMEICPDLQTKIESCKQKTCPMTCERSCSAWSNMTTTPCSVTCGGGVRYVKSRRRCRYPDCDTEHIQTTTCNSQPCLTCSDACKPWSDWSNNSCSVSCDVGISTRMRTRSCDIDDCDVQDVQESTCKLHTCLATCDADCGSWGAWKETACSVTCDDGVKSRVRNRTCPHNDCISTETSHVACRNTTCPATCDSKCTVWSTWRNSSCSASCGEGQRHHTRVRVCPESDCQTVYEVIFPCKNNTCPRTCDEKCTSWSHWQESACSQSCDEGLQTKTRIRGCPAQLQDCPMSEAESNACIMATCNETCDIKCAEWTKWSKGACSTSCGEGTLQRTKYRTCDRKLKGCSMRDTVSEHCNLGACTATCNSTCGAWSDWTAAGRCSVSCWGGVETRQRVRRCNAGPKCSTLQDREQACNKQDCSVAVQTGEPKCRLFQTFVPDPDDCTKFYQCVWGRPVKLTCPGGTGWNQSKGICDFKRNVLNCK